jgi:hypothetical protein
MPGEEERPRYEARLEFQVGDSEPAKSRRVFTWRNPFRSAPRVAAQPDCPLQVLRPRLCSYARLGSRIETMLRFDLRNISDKSIHSYFWRHASPVLEANGGFGCQPQGGMSPDACQHETAYLAWRGPLTITIDFVQLSDGTVWLTSDPQSVITRAGLDAGTRAAGDYLLRVWRQDGKDGLAAALGRIHFDVQDTEWTSEKQTRLGVFGFHAGVTLASVVAGGISEGQVEERLLALKSGLT